MYSQSMSQNDMISDIILLPQSHNSHQYEEKSGTLKRDNTPQRNRTDFKSENNFP